MDPVLRGAPTRDSACCAQVDVRAFFILLLPVPTLTSLDLSFTSDTRTFQSASLSGARSSPAAQRASSIPYRTLSKRTSSYALLFIFSFFLRLQTLTVIRSFLRVCLYCVSCVGLGFNKDNTNKLFEEYDVQKNLDTLHRVVTEARERRQRGEQPGAGGGTGTGTGKKKDLWRADLQPRAAVRAQTVPALERERDALRARLADVRQLFLFFFPIPFPFPKFPLPLPLPLPLPSPAKSPCDARNREPEG